MRWLIVVTFLLPSLLTACSAEAIHNVQPELLEIAAQQPETMVRVIVQKATHDDGAERWVGQLGGAVIQDLDIINAFAAELPARAVPVLATLASVHWVSLDSLVESLSQSQNRYYFYGPEEGQDSASQGLMPVDQAVPLAEQLYNYDTDRDSSPGLLIRRGGTADSPLGSDTVQRWRLGPFENDVWVSGSAMIRLYAALRNFQSGQSGKIWAHLVHIDGAGQKVSVIASSSVSKNWGSTWKSVKITFSDLNYFLSAGDQLEVALTVDPASADDMWVALGARRQASFLQVNIRNILSTDSALFLANSPVNPSGDTAAHSVLPLSYRAPNVATLYNYDNDRDSSAGLWIRSGGTATSAGASGQIQRWRFVPFRATTQIAPNVSLTLYAATKDFQPNQYGKLWAYLIELDDIGQPVRTIGSAAAEASDWGATWQPHTLSFANQTYAVAAGHQLEVAVTVDPASADMWLAYGATDFQSSLTIDFWSLLPQYYLETIGAPDVWEQGYEGQGVAVAVIDSGIWADSPDFMEPGVEGPVSRLIESVGIVDTDAGDKFGHGTFVAGVVGGNGASSGGYYKGTAPKVNLVNVRVSDEWGASYESSVIAGMQWVLENKDTYNIRVVNMSLNSSVDQPYNMSALNAAAEILWFNGVVVFVSVGNNASTAPGVIFPPANDPFVIAVGSNDDMESPDPNDDTLAVDFSVYATTPDGFFRPDLVAPGVDIVSALADFSNFQTAFGSLHRGALDKSGLLSTAHFVASGTSISSGVVAGAAALLLQAVPDLNPDQVKYLLMSTCTPIADEEGDGAGILNVAHAVEAALSYASLQDIPAANVGLVPSQLLLTGDDPIQWNSVNWNSVNWNSVNWNSVNWNSVNWNSTYQQTKATGNGVQAAGITQIAGGHTLRPPMVLPDEGDGDAPDGSLSGRDMPFHYFLPAINP